MTTVNATGIQPGNVTEEAVLSQNTVSDRFPIYVGAALGAGILICVFVIIVILLYRKGVFRGLRLNNRRFSTRPLFIRGFSTATQRGPIDSTAEFEIVQTMSESSQDGVEQTPTGSVSSKSENPPKKPQRRRTRTSSSNVKYENVALDANSGLVIRKSVSMNSGIPYMDSTLESRISEQDEDLDDVFH